MASAALPGLRPTVSGNPAGPTLIIVHGWPDDMCLFDSMAAKLDPDFYCVRVNLPNFGPKGPDNPIKHTGYSFDELVSALTELIIQTQAKRGRPNEPVSLVLHDWGCTTGYMLEQRHPELVKSVVSLDIGKHLAPGFFAKIFIIFYQSYIMFAWLLGFILPNWGDAIVRAAARAGKLPTPERTTCHMGYPYIQYWKLMLSRSPLIKPDPRGHCPFPCLFLYGKQNRMKPVMFHSDDFLFAISKRADSRAEMMDGDHWFLVRPSACEKTNQMVSKWLLERYKA